MKSLYETLGIDKSATTDEIKAAYRRAASKAHPDKDTGSHDAMQTVQQAYDVLGDEDRRRQYDETGSIDNDASIEGLAAMQIIDGFKQCIDQELASNASIDPVATLREAFQKFITDHSAIVAKCFRDRTRVEQRRNKVKHNGNGDNMYAHICDTFIAAISTKQRHTEQRIKVHERALEMLKDYDFCDGYQMLNQFPLLRNGQTIFISNMP